MSDIQARRLQRLAARADTLLVDEDFKAMLADLKNLAIREWAEAVTPETREAAWHDLHAVSRLEVSMRKYGEAWRMASHGR